MVAKTCLALNAKLAEVVGAHHVQMALIGDNARVPLTARHLLDNNIEAAGPWYFHIAGSLTVLRKHFCLRINAELTISVLSPNEDFRVLEIR